MDTLEALRKSTDSLLKHESVLIQLWRPPALTSDNMGGYVRTGNPEPFEPLPRFFRAVKDNVTLPLANVEFEEGKRIMGTHILIGPYNDDILVRDYFFVGDIKFLVLKVDPDRRYQTKALCGTEENIFVI